MLEIRFVKKHIVYRSLPQLVIDSAGNTQLFRQDPEERCRLSNIAILSARDNLIRHEQVRTSNSLRSRPLLTHLSHDLLLPHLSFIHEIHDKHCGNDHHENKNSHDDTFKENSVSLKKIRIG